MKQESKRLVIVMTPDQHHEIKLEAIKNKMTIKEYVMQKVLK